MIILKSNDRNPNFKFLFFIKIATFIILSWIYPYYNNQNAISKSLENGCELNISLDVRTHRSLAKSKQENELGNIRPNHKTSNYGGNNKLSYINDNNNNNNNNSYESIKRGRTNHMEAYLKNYNSKYTKEKGIKKLDCYYEKKLFKLLHKISKLAEQKNISKGRIKRIIFTRYGSLLFIISLIPLLALAIPVDKWKVHSIEKCEAKPNRASYKIDHGKCTDTLIEDNSYRLVFISISTIIILLFIIYIFIKIMKYNRIKSGMLK